MTDIEGFLAIYGHSDNLLNNNDVYCVDSGREYERGCPPIGSLSPNYQLMLYEERCCSIEYWKYIRYSVKRNIFLFHQKTYNTRIVCYFPQSCPVLVFLRYEALYNSVSCKNRFIFRAELHRELSALQHFCKKNNARSHIFLINFSALFVRLLCLRQFFVSFSMRTTRD